MATDAVVKTIQCWSISNGQASLDEYKQIRLVNM